ncbi:polyketide synthase [Aetokthonos hydrillicola]|uniref:polyketide synthase n=1 Tax=Aetokthonos hydrillicola TaxID=1550245 RepID=UPI001ABAED0D
MDLINQLVTPSLTHKILETDPHESITTLQTLTEAECYQLLVEWNDTKTDYPQNKCIHQLFEEQVENTPDAIAVILEEDHLTYHELNDRANKLAHYLQSLGVESGMLVGICLERSLEMIVALLGILKVGGVYVPLDPAYPQDRLEWMLTDTQASVLLTQSRLLDRLPPHQSQIVCLETGWGTDQSDPVPSLNVPISPDAPAYINYTSGSTGRPKGIAIPHQAVLRLVFGTNYTPLNSSQVWMQLAPISFDAATLEIWGPLLHGGQCVLYPGNGLPDPNDLKEVIQRHGVTSMWITGALFNTIITEAPDALRSVKEILTGGEALSVPHIRKAQEQLPETQFVNGYGPTESTTFTCCYRIPRPLPEGISSIPIGRPIGNTQIYILDKHLRPVPVGIVGELYIGGAGLAIGYINRPDLTKERFIPNPFSDDADARLYKTGDLVRYLPDGNVEFIGRGDNQVKIRGYRIELGEIEAALSQHPSVQDVIVLAYEKTPGNKQLVAYVTPTADQAINISETKDYLKQRLPEYMVPSTIMLLDKIPLTPNGKADRNSLPKPKLGNTGTDFIAPITSTELSLADLWCGILGLEQVGIEDNFFDLGGTSILSLQLVTRIQAKLNFSIKAVKLYQYPTIRTLAKYLDQHKSSQDQVQLYSQRQHQPAEQSDRAIDLEGIAIIGMVGRFPGANNIDDLWQNLYSGIESITFFGKDEIDPSVDPDLREDPNYVLAKGIIQGAENFDAAFFGITPQEAEIMDPQARVFLELAQEALENAGYSPDQYPGQIGIYAGSGQNTYFERHICGREDIVNRLGAFQTMLANEKDFVTTRTSYKLNLTGPSVSINTACSTSLVASIVAFKDLMNYECDIALAGGISINTPQNTGYLYQEEGMLSPDGHCRPFDAQGMGTTFNSGAGIVVLKRLRDALDAGDRIYAVIKGVGVNNDGSDKVSFTAPSVNGQASAIVQAQASAGVHPDSISYIETHGTATPLGDPIEIEALTQAFRRQTAATQYCAIGSIKSNIGHTVAAAGVAGLIKTALALYYKQIPPSLGFESPNPQIDFANSPFFVNTKLVDWPEGDTPRRAGVSSFGVGGTNAHVILEEAPVVELSGPSRAYQLLLLSAKTPTALAQTANNLKKHLQQHPDINLADVAYTLGVGRRGFNHRRFVVCRDVTEARDILESLDATRSGARETRLRDPEVVFMFPGQGSQYINMGLNLYQHEPVFQAAVDRCAEILQPLLKLDIREILYPTTAEDEAAAIALRQTIYTQPALFTVEYALSQVWLSWGVQPAAMIGHSIGEFVAACLAEVFSLEDALRLIATRGRMMWELPSGSMLSVRMPADLLVKRLTKDLAIAAINGPSLCVVSGSTEAISALQVNLEAEEIICKQLHTSHAFHSPMMDPIVEPFAQLVRTIPLASPKIPFVSTVTADWITDAQATDPMYWASHLRATVRFAEGVQTLWQHSSRVLLEVGPRTTAATLARQQAKDLKQQIAISSLGSTADNNGEWAALLQAIGQLWLAGVDIDLAAFYANEYRHRLPLPTYPFERQRFWIDPKPTALPISSSVGSSLDLQVNKSQINNQSTDHSLLLSSASISETTMSESRKQRLIPILKDILATTSGFDFTDIDETITFLEMGLDSLSLTQVALAFKKKFRVKMTFRNLLEDYSTLKTLAEFLDQTLPAEAFPAPPASTAIAASVPIETQVSAPNLSSASTTPAMIENSNGHNGSNGSATTQLPAQTSIVESLIAQQLQIISQQIELLGHNRQMAAPANATISPVPQVSPPPPSSTPSVSPPLTTSKETNGLGAAPQKSHGPGAKIQKSIDTVLSSEQQTALDRIIDRYTPRTKKSKRQAQEHRRYLADPRTVSGFTPLLKEMVYPIVTDRSSGSKLWDVDGNEYVDLTNGFGLNFFGWNPDFVKEAVIAQMEKGIEIGPQTPLAGKVAKLITEFTGMERVAFCNTGSEAVMATFRLARTVTGRNLIATFAGDYHGTFDEVLYRPGANLKTLSGAPGILPSMFENLLVLDYGTPESLEILRNRADDLAAVLVEPVRSRDPDLQPKDFLHEVRRITKESETAFIFDEVVTGFRVDPGGAQAYFNIQADMATYGKVVGGGLPIGVLAGKAEYMDALDGGFWQFGDDSIPEVGVTFFAGTFVRHPMALAAAEAVLTKLKEGGPELQRSLADKVNKFATYLNQHFEHVGAPIKINHFTSFFYVTYSDDAPHAGLLFYLLRDKGVHIWDHRPCFFTLAHTERDIDLVIKAFKDSVAELQATGLLPCANNAITTTNGRNGYNAPPQPGARLGRDPEGNPAWYISDPERPGKYLQLGKV